MLLIIVAKKNMLIAQIILQPQNYLTLHRNMKFHYKSYQGNNKTITRLITIVSNRNHFEVVVIVALYIEFSVHQ